MPDRVKNHGIDTARFLQARDASDIRVLARLITLAENDPHSASQILATIPAPSVASHVLGITGPPGVGKSSLVNRIVTDLRGRGLTAAVLAVDPSSPYSGGALLGDRIRMNEHSGDPGVYIRSMATRGILGGLSHAAWRVTQLLQTWGFDWIIVETAGVGQNEIDVVDLADTTVLVVSPALGDEVQVMKAGVMEAADLFVINKSDLPGADRAHSALEAILSRTPLQNDDGDTRSPVVFETVATAPAAENGIGELVSGLAERFVSIRESGELLARRQSHYLNEARRSAVALLTPLIEAALDSLGRRGGRSEDRPSDDPLEDARRVVKALVTSEVWRTIRAEKD